MKKKLINGLSIVVFLGLPMFLFPIGKLVMTNEKIAKLPFIDVYLADITSSEFDFQVFVDYIEGKGWTENETRRLGGLHVLEKNGETKEIVNTQVKTVFIDGKLNFTLRR